MRIHRKSIRPFLLTALVAAGCATRVPVVTAPVYPHYPFPAVPATLSGSPAAGDHERAWSNLQAGDLQAAEVGFTSALGRHPEFHPSDAGLGFVWLSRGDSSEAVARFDRALARAPAYVPALLGRGEALLETDRISEAIESFEAAFAADPSLTSLLGRVEELRFAGLMEQVAEARAARDEGRDAEARAAYTRLITVSPESGFLYLELAEVERRQQDSAAALGHLEQAVALDSNTLAAWMMMADIYLNDGDLDRGEQALRRADAIEPSEEISRRLADIEVTRRETARPAAYRELEAVEEVARGQLATLVGLRFGALLEQAGGGGTPIITDARDYEGYQWVIAVARAGIMEADANYRFQPSRSVTRAELADVVVRILRLAGRDGMPGAGAHPGFSDLAASHLSFAVASAAVAAGVLAPLEQNTFQPARLVTGEEAVAAIERLGTLIEDDRG